MLEAAYDVIVTGTPVLFHGPTRKLVILRSSFVPLRVIDEMNYVIDVFIGFLPKNLNLRHRSQVSGKMRKALCKCSSKHLRVLELVRRGAGPTRVLNLLLTHFRLLQVERELTIGAP